LLLVPIVIVWTEQVPADRTKEFTVHPGHRSTYIMLAEANGYYTHAVSMGIALGSCAKGTVVRISVPTFLRVWIELQGPCWLAFFTLRNVKNVQLEQEQEQQQQEQEQEPARPWECIEKVESMEWMCECECGRDTEFHY
jgi:hypothetical protein